MSNAQPTDFTIDPNNTSGTELAAILNRLTDSFITSHAGATRPAYAKAGLIWADDSNTPPTLYMYDGTNDQEIVTAASTGAVQTQILNTIFPVGRTYMTLGGEDPNSFLPGTWVRTAEGRAIIGAGQYDGATLGDPLGDVTYTAGDEGGEGKHSLTEDENGPHAHTGSTTTSGAHNHTYQRVNTAGNTASRGSGLQFSQDPASTTGNGDHNHNITTNPSGQGEAHENRMPYIALNIWVRTA